MAKWQEAREPGRATTMAATASRAAARICRGSRGRIRGQQQGGVLAAELLKEEVAETRQAAAAPKAAGVGQTGGGVGGLVGAVGVRERTGKSNRTRGGCGARQGGAFAPSRRRRGRPETAGREQQRGSVMVARVPARA